MNARDLAHTAGVVMPIAEYHAHEAIGKSTLDLIARDPYLVEWSRTAKVDTEKTAVFDFGDALHAICLEPDRLARDYAVAPEFNMRTNDGKAGYKAFCAENPDRIILDAGEYRQLVLMFDSVMSHPQARELIEADGLVERSWFWKDRYTGIECKCRPDKFMEGRALLVDIKSTPSLAKFCYSVEDYRYYVQDPWYCDGIKLFGHSVKMAFLVIQKTVECGRYPVQVFTLPEDVTLYGRQTYRRDLDLYARFLSGKAHRQIQELDMHHRFVDHCLESLEITT